MLTEDVYLWPPTPNPESWTSDIPNEGLAITLEDGLYDCFADYHGFYIIEPEQIDTPFLRLTLAPTENKEYLAAYVVILAACTPLWYSQTPKPSWAEVAGKIVEALKELGWREVEGYEEEGKYFRYKN